MKFLKTYLKKLILECISEYPQEKKLELKKFAVKIKESTSKFEEFMSSFEFPTRSINFQIKFLYPNRQEKADAIEFTTLSELIQWLKTPSSGLENWYGNPENLVPIAIKEINIFHRYTFLGEGSSEGYFPMKSNEKYQLEVFEEFVKTFIENCEKYPEYLI